MATNITGSFQYSWTHGTAKDGRTETMNETVSAQEKYSNLWNVGTSEETLAFPVTGVTTEGRVYLKNLDGTNYVQIGFATGVYPLRLDAGKFAWLQFDPSITAVYAKANASACNLEVTVYGA